MQPDLRHLNNRAWDPAFSIQKTSLEPIARLFIIVVKMKDARA